MSADCKRCDGHGYITSADGRYARADLCTCQSPCPVCKDDQRILTRRDDGRVFVTPCECVGLRRRIARFRAATIPAAFHGKTVEQLQARTKEEQAVKRWLLDFQGGGAPGARGLLLVGNPGVGKTHALCGLLRFLTLERGLEARYVDSFQLLHDLKIAFDQDSGSAEIMEAYCRVPLLALDELGKTRPEGWQHQVLDQIVSRRYDANLTTFVATNYPLPGGPDAPLQTPREDLGFRETLDRRVGVRIFSRLMERCRPFVLTGADRRLQS